MTSNQPASSGFRITGRHVLAGFVVFFGAVFAANAVMVTIAYRTHPGEVSVTPYEDGIAYNRTLAQKRAQATLGWTMTAGLDPSGRLEVDVRDINGAPVRGLAVEALLQRPATEAGRFTVRLDPDRPGRYVTPGAQPSGAWDVDIDARDRDGRLFHAERRILRP